MAAFCKTCRAGLFRTIVSKTEKDKTKKCFEQFVWHVNEISRERKFGLLEDRIVCTNI